MDLDVDYMPNHRPRKAALTDSKAFRRLQRELRGGNLNWDPRFHRPAETYCETLDRKDKAFWETSSKLVLKTVRIDSLDGQKELRNFIILGEKPTFPHHLVTICRPYEFDLFDINNVSPNIHSSRVEDDLKSGSISYWALKPTPSSIREVDSFDYYPSHYPALLRPNDYSLTTAFTAWDIDHDKIAQVLIWDFQVCDALMSPDQIVAQKLEFRYGTKSVVVDQPENGERYMPQTTAGACFAGLLGAQEGAGVRLLLPNKMYLYEPFGGWRRLNYGDPVWKIAPETPLSLIEQGHETHSNNNSHLQAPLVTVIDLPRIASAHLKTVLKSYADKAPVFTCPYSAFIPMKRPVRFKPGERQSFDRKCTIGFGAIESSSKMYHFFIIVLDTATRTHKIMAAKAFYSSGVFCWENMHTVDAEELFKTALARVAKARGGKHNCKVDCEALVGRMKGLEVYDIGPGMPEVIRMEESGVALMGWGVKGSR